MTVADVSASDKDTVGPVFKPLKYEIRVDTAGAHNPNNTHIRGILKPADPSQISRRICTPVTGKCKYFGFEFSGHFPFLK
jgi:hypothetical protein